MVRNRKNFVESKHIQGKTFSFIAHFFSRMYAIRRTFNCKLNNPFLSGVTATCFLSHICLIIFEETQKTAAMFYILAATFVKLL